VDSKRHNSFRELIFDYKKIMKNASQYNISIQTKIEDSEGYERCEHPLGDGINSTNMHGEDIRNNNPKSVNNQEENAKSNTQDNGNSEPENISIDKKHLTLSNAHTQRSRDHLSTSNNFMEEENKKNIYRLGNSDTWACKECKVKDDKHFMKQHHCKGVLKRQKQKAISNK
jgi:hypothetical protein